MKNQIQNQIVESINQISMVEPINQISMVEPKRNPGRYRFLRSLHNTCTNSSCMLIGRSDCCISKCDFLVARPTEACENKSHIFSLLILPPSTNLSDRSVTDSALQCPVVNTGPGNEVPPPRSGRLSGPP